MIAPGPPGTEAGFTGDAAGIGGNSGSFTAGAVTAGAGAGRGAGCGAATV
jgi:hypothetical protein